MDVTDRDNNDQGARRPIRRGRRGNRQSVKLKRQNLFATQAILYSGSFFITWIPSTIWSICHWFNIGSFWFDLFAAICEPLQGFWNMLIFIRRRKSSQEKIKRTFRAIFCCFQCRSDPEPKSEERRSSGMSKQNESTFSVHDSGKDEGSCGVSSGKQTYKAPPELCTSSENEETPSPEYSSVGNVNMAGLSVPDGQEKNDGDGDDNFHST